jgi:hypothetical protein
MKKFILVFVFLAVCTPAFAFHIGPATPAADHGEVNFGVGYFLYQAEWDGFDVEQNRGYVHLGYGLGIEDEPRWEAYIRGGAANLETADENFDADFEPFGMIGIKGAFHDGEHFGWGMALQGGIFGDFEDNGGMVEDLWEIEAGFPFQMGAGPFVLYAGPVFYRMKLERIEEEDNFGGFAGLAITLGPLSLELEGQLKSDISAGGNLTVQF